MYSMYTRAFNKLLQKSFKASSSIASVDRCFCTLGCRHSVTSTPKSGGSRLRLWHILTGISCPVAYYVWRGRERDKAIEETKYLISARRVECEDLEERAHLAFDDVLRFSDTLKLQGKDIEPNELGAMIMNIAPEGHQLLPWDLLCMFRNSSFENRRIELMEALIGLAILPCEVASPTATKEEKAELNVKNAEYKMKLVWRAVSDDMKPISFTAFSLLLDRMLRTGHFSAASIVCQTGILPPEWSILSGQGIAEIFYKRLNRSVEQSISFEEFKNEAAQEAKSGTIKCWYLLPRRKRRKKKNNMAKSGEAVSSVTADNGNENIKGVEQEQEDPNV